MSKLFKRKKSTSPSIDEVVIVNEDKKTEELIINLNQVLMGKENHESYDELNTKLSDLKAFHKGYLKLKYTLEKSSIPMQVIENLVIEANGRRVKIDFLLITNSFLCILESFKQNSRITLNLQKGVLDSLLRENKILQNIPIHTYLVVDDSELSINYDITSKAIRDMIVTLDDITMVLEGKLKAGKLVPLSKGRMTDIADKIMKHHIEADHPLKEEIENAFKGEDIIEEHDYQPSDVTINNQKKTNALTTAKVVSDVMEYVKDKPVVKGKAVSEEEKRLLLRLYRTKCANMERKRTYMIFNNETMDEIINNQPTSLSELKEIRGMGESSVEKYGKVILEIISM